MPEEVVEEEEVEVEEVVVEEVHIKRAVKLLELRESADEYELLVIERHIKALPPHVHHAAKKHREGQGNAKKTPFGGAPKWQGTPRPQAPQAPPAPQHHKPPEHHQPPEHHAPAAPPPLPPPVAPPKPIVFLPPKGTADGHFSGHVVDGNFAALVKAIRGLKWPKTIDVDWEGWTQISKLGSASYMRAHIMDASSGGKEERLAETNVHDTPYYLKSEINVSCRVIDYHYEGQDGPLTEQDTATTSLESGSNSSTTNTEGASVGIEAEEGGVGGSAGLSASSAHTDGQSSGANTSGSSATTASYAHSQRFTCTVVWHIDLVQDLVTESVTSSLRATGIEGVIDKNYAIDWAPTQEATAYTKDMVVTFDTKSCIRV